MLSSPTWESQMTQRKSGFTAELWFVLHVRSEGFPILKVSTRRKVAAPSHNWLRYTIVLGSLVRIPEYTFQLRASHSVPRLDVVGRRPIILFGTAGIAISTILLGLSGTLATVFASRFLGKWTSNHQCRTQPHAEHRSAL
jgi:hypothetical protein